MNGLRFKAYFERNKKAWRLIKDSKQADLIWDYGKKAEEITKK